MTPSRRLDSFQRWESALTGAAPARARQPHVVSVRGARGSTPVKAQKVCADTHCQHTAWVLNRVAARRPRNKWRADRAKRPPIVVSAARGAAGARHAPPVLLGAPGPLHHPRMIHPGVPPEQPGRI